jgi:hypothetical protein
MKKFHFFSVAAAVVAVLFVSVWAATGSQKVNLGASIGVAGVPVSSTARYCSNELSYLFTTPPTNATITSLVYSLGTVSANSGTFVIDSLRVGCNSVYVTKGWNGNGTLTINNFSGQPAKTTCKVSFCGKCIAGYVVAGQTVNQCNKSFTNSNLTNNYQY